MNKGFYGWYGWVLEIICQRMYKYICNYICIPDMPSTIKDTLWSKKPPWIDDDGNTGKETTSQNAFPCLPFKSIALRKKSVSGVYWKSWHPISEKGVHTRKSKETVWKSTTTTGYTTVATIQHTISWVEEQPREFFR